MYSQSDIERLSLLRQATVAGHPIGNVAGLSTDRLRELVLQERSAESGRAGGVERAALAGGGSGVDGRLAEALDAVVRMDSVALQEVLEGTLAELGQVRLLSGVIAPLVQMIGEEWRAGRLKVAQEHVATAALRTFLGQVSRPIAVHPAAPSLLVTTPAGQLHELGAVLAAAAAAGHGWRVTYAGAAMPAEEIAAAARTSGARAVALSIVHPADDPAMDGELRRLRRLLPSEVSILVGGRVSGAYADTLRDIGAVAVESLDGFTGALDRMALRPPAA